MALIVVADSIKVAGRKEALELWGPPGVSPLRTGSRSVTVVPLVSWPVSSTHSKSSVQGKVALSRKSKRFLRRGVQTTPNNLTKW